jgi:hypothetical protein
MIKSNFKTENKEFMKRLFFYLISAFVTASCAHSTGAEIKPRKSTEAKQKTEGFSCTMHPEVKGSEGDSCSKCGMKLEPSEISQHATDAYFMQVQFSAPSIEPGKDVVMSFRPSNKERETESVPLDIEHEKKIHLILASADLSWFDHIHPEYSEDGSYKVTEKFPTPGKYIAFADYKPSGAGHVVDKIDISVEGVAPVSKTYETEKFSGVSDSYSFELKPEGELAVGEPVSITGILKKDGREIDASSLDNYLGAKAHFVMISLEDKDYLHIHPEVRQGRFDLQTSFDKTGTYKVWAQFNGDGKLHTVDFILNVKKLVKSGLKADHKPEGHEHSGHSH